MTLQDLTELEYGMRLVHRTLKNADGSPMRFKVNGAPQAFKRNIQNVRVPWKHGLWDYGYITAQNAEDFELA